MRPPDLDITGLSDAFREYFSDIMSQTGIKINFREGMNSREIKDKAAIVLYRIVQEAINNIIKHANTKKAYVSLYFRGNNVMLNVWDNGKGYDPEMSLNKTQMGIRGMREMAESLDGVFAIKSAPGQGTEVSVILPIMNRQKS